MQREYVPEHMHEAAPPAYISCDLTRLNFIARLGIGGVCTILVVSGTTA